MKNIFKNKDKRAVLIITLVIFSSMFILNFLSPYVMDDFHYSFGLNGNKITSVSDIFSFQIWHYFNWGGRTIAHTLAQFFLANNKLIFDIINSAIYTGLIFLIYRLCKGDNKENPKLLAMIHLILWFVAPVFGQSFIWITGSCNYLWTSFFIILFLTQIQRNKTHGKVGLGLVFISGLLAGWSNENSGLGCLVAALLLAHTKEASDKLLSFKKSSLTQKIGVAGCVAGYFLLICAPGNYMRLEVAGGEGGSGLILLKRLLDIIEKMVIILWPLIIAKILLIHGLFYREISRIPKTVLVFSVASFVSMISMIVSPEFPLRSWTIIIIFETISVIMLAFKMDSSRATTLVFSSAACILTLFFAGSYVFAVKDIKAVSNVWNYRKSEMVLGKEKGILDYSFPIYDVKSPRNPAYGMDDLYPEKDDPNNRDKAKFFGVNSITSE